MEAKLKHAHILESRMIELLPKIRKGDGEARERYEWYMNAAKLMPLKDLLGLVKLLSPSEEVNEGFDGFDDG